ncbi:MAG TPA: hypothetical protein VK674_01615 [Candidatus Limnocylindria bacterium]|nr:hypothetical protein [Candidatus Limnocylindria bacterium]
MRTIEHTKDSGSSVDVGDIITRVMRSDGWIRYALAAHDVHPDPASWQNRPGADVAHELLTLAAHLPPSSKPGIAETRAAFIEQGRTATTQAIGSIAGTQVVAGFEVRPTMPYDGSEGAIQGFPPRQVSAARYDLPA